MKRTSSVKCIRSDVFILQYVQLFNLHLWGPNYFSSRVVKACLQAPGSFRVFTCQKIIGFVDETGFKVFDVKLHIHFFFGERSNPYGGSLPVRDCFNKFVLLESSSPNNAVGRKSTAWQPCCRVLERVCAFLIKHEF